MTKLSEHESSVLRWALTDFAVKLRTNQDTDKTMPENEFLNSNVSPQRKANYLSAMGLRAELDAGNVVLK